MGRSLYVFRVMLLALATQACGTGAAYSALGNGYQGTNVGVDAAPVTVSSNKNGHEAWAWVYTDWQTSLTVIGNNPQSFTHVSPTFYSLNYDYTSGVAFYSTCPTSSGANCSANGANNFDGMTTAQFAAKVRSFGMATVPAIYAGAYNHGTDQGVANILANTNGARANFISAMVQEAVNNGYAGYNLDWEMGPGVTGADADAFVAFVNAFKAALAPHGMSLSVDAIVSNINGTYCSGNDGYLDFGKLATSAIDRVIIEDYTPDMGSTSARCQPVTLNSSSPALCPLNGNGDNVTAVGLMNYMCGNLPPSMIVIGLESNSQGTNDIAGSAIATMESYGLKNVAVWPQAESGYPFLSANGLSASQTSWYALLSSFLAH